MPDGAIASPWAPRDRFLQPEAGRHWEMSAPEWDAASARGFTVGNGVRRDVDDRLLIQNKIPIDQKSRNRFGEAAEGIFLHGSNKYLVLTTASFLDWPDVSASRSSVNFHGRLSENAKTDRLKCPVQDSKGLFKCINRRFAMMSIESCLPGQNKKVVPPLLATIRSLTARCSRREMSISS